MTNIQSEIDRLSRLRRRAMAADLDDNQRDRELIRLLDSKIADLYKQRMREPQTP